MTLSTKRPKERSEPSTLPLPLAKRVRKATAKAAPLPLVKSVGLHWDLNSIWHTGFGSLKELAERHIQRYMANRGGAQLYYKGPWRNSWGAIRERIVQDIDTKGDWDNLEELFRLRAATSGELRYAARVDIKAHFKTRGNAGSSPPPPRPTQQEIAPQVKGRSKSRPSTIRQGRDNKLALQSSFQSPLPKLVENPLAINNSSTLPNQKRT